MIFHFFFLSRSRSFDGQGHIYHHLWKGLIIRNNVCEYEEIQLRNKKVKAQDNVLGWTDRLTDKTHIHTDWPTQDKNNMPHNLWWGGGNIKSLWILVYRFQVKPATPCVWLCVKGIVIDILIVMWMFIFTVCVSAAIGNFC